MLYEVITTSGKSWTTAEGPNLKSQEDPTAKHQNVTKQFMERFHVKIRRAMGTMNRFTERDSPESQRVSHFQRCGTRPTQSTL